MNAPVIRRPIVGRPVVSRPAAATPAAQAAPAAPVETVATAAAPAPAPAVEVAAAVQAAPVETVAAAAAPAPAAEVAAQGTDPEAAPAPRTPRAPRAPRAPRGTEAEGIAAAIKQRAGLALPAPGSDLARREVVAAAFLEFFNGRNNVVDIRTVVNDAGAISQEEVQVGHQLGVIANSPEGRELAYQILNLASSFVFGVPGADLTNVKTPEDVSKFGGAVLVWKKVQVRPGLTFAARPVERSFPFPSALPSIAPGGDRPDKVRITGRWVPTMAARPLVDGTSENIKVIDGVETVVGLADEAVVDAAE